MSRSEPLTFFLIVILSLGITGCTGSNGLDSETIRASGFIEGRVYKIASSQGGKVVEGEVKNLLKSNVLKVTIEVDDLDKTKSVLQSTKWYNKIESIKGRELNLNLEQNEIPELNKYLVDNGINVSAIIPVRSLEDYFLSITAEAK